MAYKFTIGTTTFSGSINTIDGTHVSSSQIQGSQYVSGAIVEASTILKIGSAQLTEAEFEFTDGITAGTVTADKAVVVDSAKDIGTFRDITGSALAFTGGESSLFAVDIGGGYGSTGITLSDAGVIQADGAITSDAAITAGTSFVIGSADITEAELEMLDGVTKGTGSAGKVLVLNTDGNILINNQLTASVISGSEGHFTDLTVSADSLVVGTTTISEGEIGYLDGITAGTVTADKAVVVDSAKDIGTFRDVTGSALSFTGGESALLALDIGGGYGSTGITLSDAGVIQADSTITGSAIEGAAHVSGSKLFASIQLGQAGVPVYGDGSNLSGIASLGNTGTTQVLFNLTGSLTGKETMTYNIDDGEFSVGALHITGAAEFNGNVTVGNASADVTTINGQLSGNTGALFSDLPVGLGTSGVLYFSTIHTGETKISANGGNNLSISAAGDIVFGPGGENILPDSNNSVSLGDEGALAYKNIYMSGSLHYGSTEVVTASDTVLDETNSYVICNGSDAQNVYLPEQPHAGNWFSIKRSTKMVDNAVTIVSASAGTGKLIDGEANLILSESGSAVTLIYDGSSWNIF